VATGFILPDYIVSNFLPLRACRRCGRSDRSFKLLFPHVNWREAEIKLVYPLRCPCGGSGCVPIVLPVLKFGYLLASITMADAARGRRSKTAMTVTPNLRSDLLEKIFSGFDRLIRADRATVAPPVRVAGSDANSLRDNDIDRIKFGFNRDEWTAFRRRLGLGEAGNRADLDEDGEQWRMA